MARIFTGGLGKNSNQCWHQLAGQQRKHNTQSLTLILQYASGNHSITAAAIKNQFTRNQMLAFEEWGKQSPRAKTTQGHRV